MLLSTICPGWDQWVVKIKRHQSVSGTPTNFHVLHPPFRGNSKSKQKKQKLLFDSQCSLATWTALRMQDSWTSWGEIGKFLDLNPCQTSQNITEHIINLEITLAKSMFNCRKSKQYMIRSKSTRRCFPLSFSFMVLTVSSSHFLIDLTKSSELNAIASCTWEKHWVLKTLSW